MALSKSALRDDDWAVPSRDLTDDYESDPVVALEAELAHQQRVLTQIARGEPLEQTLSVLCRHVEQHFAETHCTVLLLDREMGVLRHGASPTLPAAFSRQIDGLPVGEGMGACGTAAARGQAVVVSDVLDDPLTVSFSDLAQRFSLGSVWSHPLRRVGGEVLGTFAVYRPIRYSPSPAEINFVISTGNLASLAIDHDRSQRALQVAANFDALTGLPNRSRFLELVNAELHTPGRRISVMMLEVDRFQQINQSLGHIAGDRLLVEIGERLRRVVKGNGIVARFASDAFALMMPELDARSMRELVGSVSAAVRQPFHIEGVELLLTASIGIASSERSIDAFGLVRKADTAVQAARAGGPGRHHVYDRKLRAQQVERLQTETELRKAIERRELVVHYQPILNVPDRSWSGVEALVRWQHPERGLLSPDKFIPLAEETGLIVPLGKRVLELVCEQARTWSQTLPDIHIAVNASVVQLGYPTIAAEIQDMVERSGLKPSSLMLEVTESALMEELDTARAVLEQLDEFGVRILIDDFGTGYSSLARLGELPISGLKIDRRFVRGLGHDPTVMPVIRAIADLARAYGLEVVVEGIEDSLALAGVDQLGCEYAQGYHLGRPAPAAVVEEQLAAPPLLDTGLA
jgi:c-di-GMP-specific phosphodiesterase